MVESPVPPPPKIAVERLSSFDGSDINDICDAAEAAIVEGGGFGWLTAPPRHVFETYWRGVLLVPERQLLVGRLDGVIAGAAQLVRPPRYNEAQAHAATLTGHFVAPWARGHGMAASRTAHPSYCYHHASCCYRRVGGAGAGERDVGGRFGRSHAVRANVASRRRTHAAQWTNPSAPLYSGRRNIAGGS